jgi:hypothetical protein
VNDVIVGAAILKSEKRFTLCLDKVWETDFCFDSTFRRSSIFAPRRFMAMNNSR